MSLREIEMRRGSTKAIAIGAACAVVLLGVFLYLLIGGPSPTTTSPNSHVAANPREAAVKALAKETSVETCRNALNQINSYYAQASKDHPPTLDKETQTLLQERFDLKPDMIAEIEGSSYTLLDAHHLDQCFLLRDAARAIEGDARGERKPLDQATDAFAWVVRQVRLQEGVFPTVPPQFALRRGWGTALDRALVFLALLEQLGGEGDKANRRFHLHGCLVGWPKSGEVLPELWACGVLVDNEPKLYLFDPRLGLPLPGPNGQGVATLYEARKDAAVLEQLTVTKDHPYDVTLKRAQEAEIYQCCSLSALAPRMRFLQDNILIPEVQVHLAVDALEDEKMLKAAAATEEKPVPVKVFPYGPSFLRLFLLKEEGGTDQGAANGATNQRLFSFEMVPWNDLPPPFNDEQQFPVRIGLGQRVRSIFAAPFWRFALEAEQGRDLMLRGDYPHAIEALSKERTLSHEQHRELQKLQNDPELRRKVYEWIDNAQGAFAAQLRAPKNDQAAQDAAQQQVEAVWKGEKAQVIATLLNGAVARTRGEETTYYLALCKHELAAQAQVRLDVLASKGQPPKKAEAEWNDAVYWWQEFVDEFPAATEREAVRQMHGRALEMHGKPDEAAKVWEKEVKDSKHPLETVACLYLAAQARKK